jgi:hypothetical protein
LTNCQEGLSLLAMSSIHCICIRNKKKKKKKEEEEEEEETTKQLCFHKFNRKL